MRNNNRTGAGEARLGVGHAEGVEAVHERDELPLGRAHNCRVLPGLGTITGEHGIGSFKLRWLPQEQSERLRELQHRIKEVFDPHAILNPGKAV